MWTVVLHNHVKVPEEAYFMRNQRTFTYSAIIWARSSFKRSFPLSAEASVRKRRKTLRKESYLQPEENSWPYMTCVWASPLHYVPAITQLFVVNLHAHQFLQESPLTYSQELDEEALLEDRTFHIVCQTGGIYWYCTISALSYSFLSCQLKFDFCLLHFLQTNCAYDYFTVDESDWLQTH